MIDAGMPEPLGIAAGLAACVMVTSHGHGVHSLFKSPVTVTVTDNLLRYSSYRKARVPRVKYCYCKPCLYRDMYTEVRLSPLPAHPESLSAGGVSEESGPGAES